MMYELTFLLIDEGGLKSVETMVESFEGKIIEKNKWGQRDLAYPIKKQQNAHYFTWQVELAAKNLLPLKNKLNYEEKLLRYLILKIEDKPKKTKTSSKKTESVAKS